MHMWSVFPWPGRTMGASFALLGWANPSFPPAALRFKQWLWGGIGGCCGKKASQDIPFGKKMGHPGLDCCDANASKHNGHLSQEPGKHIPPTHCPQTSQRKEQDGGMWRLEPVLQQAHVVLLFWIFSVVLNLLRICQMNSKAEGRLLVLEDSGPAWWWCGGWSIYLLMTDMLENSNWVCSWERDH